jgi:hypothetical protein
LSCSTKKEPYVLERIRAGDEALIEVLRRSKLADSEYNLQLALLVIAELKGRK